MDVPHIKTVEEVFEFFKVTEDEGLTPDRVTRLREKYGLNGMLLSAVNISYAPMSKTMLCLWRLMDLIIYSLSRGAVTSPQTKCEA